MLSDVDAQKIVDEGVILFFSDHVHKIEELVDRVLAEKGLYRFPGNPESFEVRLRGKIMLSMIGENSKWN